MQQINPLPRQVPHPVQQLPQPEIARITPGLSGVSETMLWALHNRASEAVRPQGVLDDPESVRICRAIDYDFAGRFRDPAGSLAARAAAIDSALREWLKLHPDGCIVSLGEGLETQRHRVDNGQMRWVSVDLPDAIGLRERFITPTDRFRHLSVSALDPAWMDEVDPSQGVFIIAQGLLMYLRPEAVRRLLCGIADRFPGAQLMFDVIPRWFSNLTLSGLHQTPEYRLPPMPWGIGGAEIARTLRRWHPRLATVTFLEYDVPRGWLSGIVEIARHVPVIRHQLPGLVRVTIGTGKTRQDKTSNIVWFNGRGPRSQDLAPTRKTHMTNLSDTDTMHDVFAAATEHAGRSNDLAMAAGQIVAKRMALGMAAAANPFAADHEEFGRMVPEKMEAFSAAGMIMMGKSSDAGFEMTRLATDEVMMTVKATMDMAACTNPMAMAEVQGKFAMAWFERVASTFATMGMMAISAQDAAMHPIRETVAANTERLG